MQVWSKVPLLKRFSMWKNFTNSSRLPNIDPALIREDTRYVLTLFTLQSGTLMRTAHVYGPCIQGDSQTNF